MIEIEVDTLPAGREMDALIEEYVMHEHYCNCPPVEDCAVHSWASPWSTDIYYAWQVVEKLPRTFWPEVRRMDNGTWCCEIVGRGDTPVQVSPEPLALCFADTAPLAICRAALKAVSP